MTDTHKIITPPKVKEGDTIGIIAPSGSFDKETFQKGVNAIESMGFKAFIPDSIFQHKGYLAGDDKTRADSVNQCFANDGVKAIVTARGGFGALRILSLLDFNLIKNNPKRLVGFSDITALLISLYHTCGFVCFHGPTVSTLAEANPITKRAFYSALTSDQERIMTPKEGITVKKGTTTGPLTGGNLTTLCHLLGTGFFPDLRGHILFLEDINEAPYRIDRMLTQMKMAGCFKGLRGLVLGAFTECGNLFNIIRIVKNIFSDSEMPILAGFDSGHGDINITFPLGIPARLDTENSILHINPDEKQWLME